jgi:hypothetical protein
MVCFLSNVLKSEEIIMSDMEGFLGKVVTDAVKNANQQDMIGDGFKLINQRQINVTQQKQIIDDKDYIRELEQTINNLRSENDRLKNQKTNSYLPPVGMRMKGSMNLDLVEKQKLEAQGIPFKWELTYEENLLEYERKKNAEYEALLSKPMHVIAEKNKNFKETYEQQQTILADWMVSQKAFKEVAIQFGKEKGLSPDEVIEMGLDKDVDVLQDKHDPSHRTNVGDSTIIGPRREALLEKAQKDKAARKAKKGS